MAYYLIKGNNKTKNRSFSQEGNCLQENSAPTNEASHREKPMLLSDEETAQDQGSVSMMAIQSRNASYQFNKLQPL